MRIRSSQMKSREAVSLEQDSPNSSLRLLSRQASLLYSLVVVLILVSSRAVPGASEAVLCRGVYSAAAFPLCLPFTVSSFVPLCYDRGRKYDNAIPPSSSRRRVRSFVARTQLRMIPESQQQRGHHQQGQQGPLGRQRQRGRPQQYEAFLLLDSGIWPTAHEYSSFFSGVTCRYFQQTTPKPPLFLTVAATLVHSSETEQRSIFSGQFLMKLRCCDRSRLTRDAATPRTSSLLSAEVVAEPPTGRLLDEGSGVEYSAGVKTASVASIIQQSRPCEPGAKRLRSKEQHPHTAGVHEAQTSSFSSVEHVSRVPPENSGGRIYFKERQEGNAASNGELAAPADIGVESSLTCVPGLPAREVPFSPCRHTEEVLQKGEGSTPDVGFPFPRLGLFPNFVEALTHLGVHNATEIQQLGLPAIFSGADIVLGAETGSGKTLGYLLGILQNVLVQKMIHERKEDEATMKREDLPLPRHYPYAIIVVPTRELALQVAAWSRRLCRKSPVSTQLLLGSYARWPFGTLTLPTSPDVILCTPQVLAGFTRGGGYKKKLSLFEQAQMLVIDEADMLLEGGYKKLMESVFFEFRKADKMLAATGKRRTQYVFAAATIPERGPVSIRKTIDVLCPGASFLCTNSLHHQRRELQQEFVEIRADASFGDKTDLLLEKLREIPLAERVMIFCNTAQTAKQVLQVLEKTLPPAANPKLFSSDLNQQDRARNLGLFAREKSKVLVCTDAASRGLDIVGVRTVIQFDFALNAVTHLHRVGRVARAGKFGRAINFYEPASKPLVDAVRQAAYDPTRRSLADTFSRRRSFRKNLKKAESSSVALVVDHPSAAVGVSTRLQVAKQ